LQRKVSIEQDNIWWALTEDENAVV
jgi:hypothetical protein